MDFTKYKFEMFDGWPPDGEPGQFFGFGINGEVAILRWIDDAWHGLRFQFVEGARPIVPEFFRRGEGTESYVVRWASAPWGKCDE